MKPKDLDSYLGSFMWLRYCKQRNLDLFIHMLECIAEIDAPEVFVLPSASMNEVRLDENLSDIDFMP